MNTTTTTTKKTPAKAPKKAAVAKPEAAEVVATKPTTKRKPKASKQVVAPTTWISADGEMTHGHTVLEFLPAPSGSPRVVAAPKAPKNAAPKAPKNAAPKDVTYTFDRPEVEPARRHDGKGWLVPVLEVQKSAYSAWKVVGRDTRIDVIVGGTVQKGSRTVFETPEGLVELHSVQRQHGFDRAWHAVIAETMEPTRVSDRVHSGLIITRHETTKSTTKGGATGTTKGRGSALGAPMTHILRHLGVLGAKRAEAVAVVQALRSAGEWNGDVPREATVQTQLGWGRRGTVETKISQAAKDRLAEVLAAVKG